MKIHRIWRKETHGKHKAVKAQREYPYIRVIDFFDNSISRSLKQQLSKTNGTGGVHSFFHSNN
jgi:hypothetical protein